MRLPIVALGIVCLLGACMERSPYWVMEADPPGDARLLALPDRAGVVVTVSGQDDAAADLADALVDALIEENIPAGSGPTAGNRLSYRLRADIASAGPAIGWQLANASGEVVGGGNVAGQAGSGAAARIAAETAALIRGTPRRAAEREVGATMPPVLVEGLTGAPGDGKTVVPRMLRHLLQSVGYRLAADGEEDAVIVSGRYSSTGTGEGTEDVVLAWRVVGPDGTEIGVVDQANTIPAGSLDQAWGDSAYFIAEGAAEGIHALLATLYGAPRPARN